MLLVIAALLLVVLVVTAIVRAVQIIPQATAAVVERLGRFKAVEEPGLVFLVPFVDKIRARIDLREQVRSFPPQPVITKDNLTVNIDTVVYYQVTNPKAAVYEIADYINGVEQTTTTTLRNVVGGLSLEETLTARDEINSQLRGELDKVTGGWGIRIARVEIKAIEPPASIQESMERQMKADREKRAMILTAEGQRESAIRSAEGNKQSQILTAEGAKQAAILNAEADRQSRILRAQGERAAQYLQAQGEAKAIEKVFAAIKSGRPTPELLAYQYLQTLPQMAQGDANKVWIVPSDFGKALEGFTKMLGAPGGDGVFRFEPSPVEDVAPRPEDDDESIKDWFDTSPDPELARAVADAQAQARAEIPPAFTPNNPAPPLPSASSPGELPSRAPDELPTGAGGGRVGLPAGVNRHASAEWPSGAGERSAGPPEWSSGAGERSPGRGWSSGAGERSPGRRNGRRVRTGRAPGIVARRPGRGPAAPPRPRRRRAGQTGRRRRPPRRGAGPRPRLRKRARRAARVGCPLRRGASPAPTGTPTPPSTSTRPARATRPRRGRPTADPPLRWASPEAKAAAAQTLRRHFGAALTLGWPHWRWGGRTGGGAPVWAPTRQCRPGAAVAAPYCGRGRWWRRRSAPALAWPHRRWRGRTGVAAPVWAPTRRCRPGAGVAAPCCGRGRWWAAALRTGVGVAARALAWPHGRWRGRTGVGAPVWAPTRRCRSGAGVAVPRCASKPRR